MRCLLFSLVALLGLGVSSEPVSPPPNPPVENDNIIFYVPSEYIPDSNTTQLNQYTMTIYYYEYNRVISPDKIRITSCLENMPKLGTGAKKQVCTEHWYECNLPEAEGKDLWLDLPFQFVGAAAAEVEAKIHFGNTCYGSRGTYDKHFDNLWMVYRGDLKNAVTECTPQARPWWRSAACTWDVKYEVDVRARS